jgi:O-antigen ligase
MLILFVAILGLNDVDVKRLIYFILFLVSVGAVVGVAQFLIRSPILKFHDISHDASLIGFFANKNHMAISLVAAWILALGLVNGGAHRKSKSKYSILVIFAIVLPLVFATNSRAGLFLLIMSGFFIALKSFGKNRILLILGAVGISLISLVAIYYIPAVRLIAARFGGATEDGRWLIFERSVQLVDHSWPFGTGLASYAKVFKSYERLEWVGPQFVNNAHNDYLEYIIEGGILSAVNLAFFAFALLNLSLCAKKMSQGDKKNKGSDLFLANVGIIFLFCFHSFVDYPLRRPASAVIFVVACAISCRFMLALINKLPKNVSMQRS